MMRATDFEFRNRWWLFGTIFGLSFALFAFDHRPVAVRLARLTLWQGTAEQAVFSLAALIMVMAALVRTWGSAYLGRQVVHDAKLHSETLHADGPYRYVRNPLYLGNVLMAFAMALIAPLPGAVIILVGIPLYCCRLIGREEAALEAQQGESYRNFMRAVPRLFPSLRPRIAASGGRPDWKSGLAAEAYFWSFALGTLVFAATLRIVWFYAGLVASPVLSWLAGIALRGKAAAAPGPSAR